MTVTVANLTMGAGVLYTGAFGATEPADTDIDDVPGVAWTDVGATVGGLTFRYTPTYADLEADQLVDHPGRRLVRRELVLMTSLAEVTLENLVIATNTEGSISSDAGPAAYTSLEPDAASAAVQPVYKALIFDGFAEGTNKRRRVIVRKALSVAQFEMAYRKDGQTLIPVEFHAHYVDASTKPWKIVDET